MCDILPTHKKTKLTTRQHQPGIKLNAFTSGGDEANGNILQTTYYNMDITRTTRATHTTQYISYEICTLHATHGQEL